MWGITASSTANSHQMGSLLMDHGTCMSHSISAGNSGTARVTVGTTACFLERKKGLNLVTSLSSIMENGHFDVCMVFRLLLLD